MNLPDIADELLSTVDSWRDVLLELDDERVRYRPEPKRWSIAEVIGHLVDSACNNHQRFVRAQETQALTFPKYEQNHWVIANDYQQSSWSTLVHLWWAYNQHLAQVIRKIPTSELPTPCTITPYETCTLEFLVVDYLDHLKHHLVKIRERLDGEDTTPENA